MGVVCKTVSVWCVLLLWIIGLGTATVHAQSTAPQDQLFISNGIEQNQARISLEQLQQQINEQSEKTTDPQQQLQMIQQRLDILHTLTVDARLNQQPKQMSQLQQALRSDAWKLRQSDNPKQRAIGEYWHLLCDITDIKRLTRDLESSQRACISKMEQFLARNEEGAEPIEPQTLQLLQQVRLALLQLYDQRGQSVDACRLVSKLKQMDPENLELRQYLQLNYGYCHLIGQKFNNRLTTTDGKTWDSREKIGKPIVIYFWPGVGLAGKTGNNYDKSLSIDPLWEQLRRTWANVLLVDLSRSNESGLQIPSIPWPCYREDESQFRLTSYFHVQSLPRVVVIDKHGLIQSIGGPSILSVLEQLLEEK